MSIYEYTVKDTDQNEVSMADYKGKVLLIVNTATACGFTPQYEGLQSLYDRYKDRGFEILDFPCNQFLNQAPGTDEEIVGFCQTKYNVTFKTFHKIEVNGSGADPLFVYLRKASKGRVNDRVKWNFTKFLVDQQGNVLKRYAPTTTPEDIEADIVKLLEV